MTAKGLVVTEVQEEIAGLPSSDSASVLSSSASSNKTEEPVRRSPIAELLYMRWLEGLKLKWPSLT